MDIKYPLIYNGFSHAIGKPHTVVVVRRPGDFYLYVALKDKKPLHTSSEYNERGAHVYDDPSRGVFWLPISPRNELQIETEVIEGASEEQIETILKELDSITFEDLKKVTI